MAVNPRGNSWEANFMAKGHRFRKSFKAEHLALAWEAKVKADIAAGLKPSDIEQGKEKERTLQDLCDFVYKSRWSTLKTASRRLALAQGVVDLLGSSRPVSSLSRLDTIKVKTEGLAAGLGKGTINLNLAALSVMVNTAVEMEWLDHYFKMGSFKRVGGRKRFFTPEEQQRIWDWCEEHGRQDFTDVLTIAADTGFRKGEVLKIIRKDVKGENLWTYDTKNGQNREVPLTPRAKQVLLRNAIACKSPEERLFKIHPQCIWRIWSKMRKELGFKDDKQFVPHVLRHTFVSELLHNGVDLKTVQELAGHSDIKTTQGYAQTSPAHKTMAIEKLATVRATSVSKTLTQAAS